jgi:two-component sensor histidine kinase
MSGPSPAMPIEQQLREMNDALLVSSVRQHDMAEQAQLAAALVRESEERYRTLFDLVPVAVYSCDTVGVIEKFNRRAVELWGREPESGDTDERFCGSFKLFRPDGSFLPHAECPMAEVLSGKIPEVRDAEVLIERPDGSRIAVIVNIRPLKNQHGELTGAINCFIDITERKHDEERQVMLARELQHRTKNLLAVIQSIAERSLTSGRRVDEARQALIPRLHALAHATDLLMDADWKGASVKDVVERVLETFAGRYSIEGEHVALTPSATQGMALVVHELCTNAHKYGAFSMPAGKVTIRWSIEGDGEAARFVFRWHEWGGPRVTPPEQVGFGTTLLHHAIGGAVALPHIDYAPEGLTYMLEVPLATFGVITN